MRVFGTILMALGALVVALVPLMIALLPSHACGMATAGCRTPPGRLIQDFVTSGESALFWIIAAMGVAARPPHPILPADAAARTKPVFTSARAVAQP